MPLWAVSNPSHLSTTPLPPLVLVVVHLGVVEYARTQVRLTVQGSFTVNSETTCPAR